MRTWCVSKSTVTSRPALRASHSCPPGWSWNAARFVGLPDGQEGRGGEEGINAYYEGQENLSLVAG